jgi:hypothetical protein
MSRAHIAITDIASSARWRRVSTSVAVGTLGVGAIALLASRNPNVPGSYGVCPFRAATGWDCPFCGGLRGTYSLLHGDVLTALDHNVLLPLYLAVGLALAVSVVWRGSAASLNVLSSRQWWALAAAIIAFGVLRNLPMFPYLGSGA